MQLILLNLEIIKLANKAENNLADFKSYGIDNTTFRQNLKVICRVSEC